MNTIIQLRLIMKQTLLYTKRILSGIIFLVLMESPIRATDYYVALNGNDSYLGTKAQPWQTISKVNSVGFAPGGTRFFLRKVIPGMKCSILNQVL